MKKVKMTLDGKTLTANFEENQTAVAIVEKIPLQLDMMNLYSRELTYRFKQALPANEPHTTGYVVGDIAYWIPRHSFVIFYKQTGEVISDLQMVGHINDQEVLAHLHRGGHVQLTLVSTD